LVKALLQVGLVSLRENLPLDEFVEDDESGLKIPFCSFCVSQYW
jgi:hypothetical protein